MNNLEEALGFVDRDKGCLWVGAGVLAAGLLLLVLIFGFPMLIKAPSAAPTPVLQVIVAPSATATFTPAPTATATAAVTATSPPPEPVGALRTGELVEVTGTGGDGLRLRSGPSLEAVVNELAFESEVFEVQDGPIDADGYTWWYLVNPYDASKQGWGVANYIRPLSP